MSDTYVALVAQLGALMAELPPQDAAALANELTARVNRCIASSALGQPDDAADGLPPRVARVLPTYLMSYATLGLPWEAYRRVHGARGGELAGETIAARLICSLPESLTRILRAGGSTPLWSGSLLDALGLVLDGARQEVVMMNPYWSALGVQALLRRITRASLAGVRITVLTQPRDKFDAAEREGVDLFVGALAAKGAFCVVLAPSQRTWPVPLLHAKAIVADRSHAYLGSANLTGNGMDFSVELGMAFGGVLARQLADWLAALAQGLCAWDAQA
jgi:phosphatidylserine/phosphatidylglycerophosphate/cardiolipin synthase-like enzyme